MKSLRLMRSVVLIAFLVLAPLTVHAAPLPVTRATLPNGLRVVVVHDGLAPVVTTMLNYKVGSNEQPTAGLAHATEHMMFRGSKTLSSSQLMDAIDVTGGDFDADTQPSVTQYFFTVPSQYLSIALHAERSRATGLLMAQSQWNQERGAITQEVTQDNSNVFYRLFHRMQTALLGGTPYANNTLGTVYDFAHSINHRQLIDFYDAWYHPNNAVYVIVGDVDPAATIAQVRRLFGDIPSKPLPPRPQVKLRPIHANTYTETSDQPFTAVLLGYRLPGFASKDFAAANVLSDVLNSERSSLTAIARSGKALFTGFQLQPFAKTSIGIGFIGVPVTTKPQDAQALADGVIAAYRRDGVPQDLVEASIRREVAQLEYNATSIPGLAFEWSDAIVQGLSSPDAAIDAYRRVTARDVDRLLRQDLVAQEAVVGYAVPKNLGTVSLGNTSLAKEVNTVPPSFHQPLPAWAQSVLNNLHVPAQTLHPVDTKLANGLRVIVQPERSTDTVTVSGGILNNPKVQAPIGKEGIGDLTNALFAYGTTSFDRLAFAAELDRIAANEQGGTAFSVQVLRDNFERGVALLADNELHPRFAQSDFAIVKQQTLGALAGEMTSPAHLAAVAQSAALYPQGDPERRFADPKSVGGLTLADVKAWYADTYRPDLTTIIVIGNVDPNQAEATIAKYFGEWTAHGPKPNTFPPPVRPNKRGAANIPATGRVQSSVDLVETIGLLRTDPDWPAMAVANMVLSGGFYSSLLYHDLREVHGYAYSVGSHLDAGKVRSTFSVTYGSDPEKVIPAEQIVVADLQRMQTQPVESDRLLRAKAQLMGDVPLALDSYEGVVNVFGRYAALDLPLNQNLIDAQAELNMTPQVIEAAMRRWIRPQDLVRIVTGPPPR